MKKITAHDPSQWKKLDPAQPILFHAVNGNRKVQFDLNCSEYAAVLVDYDIDNEEDSLVFLAQERGMFSVEFTIANDAMVQIQAPQGAYLFIREHLQDASYVPEQKESFTNPAPERTRSKHVDRVMLEASYNKKRREHQYDLEQQRRLKRLSELEDDLEQKIKKAAEAAETIPKQQEEPEVKTEDKQEESKDETST